MALVVITHGFVERTVDHRRWRGVINGLLFGLGAIGAMQTSAVIGFGIILDSRCVIVAAAGAFGGPIAAVIATALAEAFRFFMGGSGAYVGMAGILISGVVGLAWHYRYDVSHGVKVGHLAALALLTSLHVLTFLWLPVADPIALTLKSAATLIPLYLFGTIVMGSMMAREIRLITRQRELEAETLSDPLTGLANRRAMNAVLAEALATAHRRGTGLVLMVIDIDHFKRVNDTLGHAVGDDVLRSVARLLQPGMRRVDLVCRHGGEEFCILLPNTKLPTGRRIAERIRKLIRAVEIPAGETSLHITVSIGLAEAETHSTAASLYSAADAALYMAKRSGRDRVCIGHDDGSEEAALVPDVLAPLAQSYSLSGPAAVPAGPPVR
ncbi:diguanylate cyclase [Aurantimonas sp. VKM B-3413]|uniref:diguanylate cyclase n=1 Tax=Aurantimonas sp. VKM B-3413 TaxID=2779401 RepID=UPI001E36C20F|nr:diguanylate cyclase [Aurantimonas sp. VKM B-3413]MCB8839290.1 diguanylate cyclase [Aurantimonas sp. VKM B-3413]